MGTKRHVQDGEVRQVPSYYNPRKWRVRARLKFLITRPRLREVADRYGLIVGVVDASIVNMAEEHMADVERRFWFGEPQVFIGGVPLDGVTEATLNVVETRKDGEIIPIWQRKQ